MLFCLDFFYLRSRSFLTPGMVLLLSSNAETSVIKRGCFFFKGGKKSSRGTLTALLLVASLCFVDVTEGILESCMSHLVKYCNLKAKS